MNVLYKMEKSVRMILPSPKFNKCESVPAKKYFISCDLPFLTSPSSESPLSMAAKHKKNTKDLEIPNQNTPRRFYKTEIQQRKPEQTSCDKNRINQLIGSAHLSNKLSKLSTPDDIAAWKEERRKRYPTVANVLLKQKVKEQKNKRGELLEYKTKRFGKTSYRKWTRNIDNSNCSNRYIVGNNRKRLRRYKRSLNIEEKVCETKSPNNAELKIKCINYTHTNGKVNSSKNVQCAEKSDRITEVNALLNLSQLYGSSDNSEVETEPECNNTDHYKGNDKETEKSLNGDKFERLYTPLKLTSGNNRERNNSQIPNEESLLIDEAPEELPIVHELKDDTTDIAHSNSKTIINVPPQQMQNKSKWTRSIQNTNLILHKRRAYLRKQNTILEKLLESIQRHERNVLLQCVRFVCATKFFNKCN